MCRKYTYVHTYKCYSLNFFRDISWIFPGFVKWAMWPCRLLVCMQVENEEFWIFIFEVRNFLDIHWHDIKFTFFYSSYLLIVYKSRVAVVFGKKNCVLQYIGNMVNTEESILKHFNSIFTFCIWDLAGLIGLNFVSVMVLVRNIVH